MAIAAMLITPAYSFDGLLIPSLRICPSPPAPTARPATAVSAIVDSAAMRIPATTTGAAKAVGLVIPELQGKLTGISMRVPVPTGSVVDLTAITSKKVTAQEVNAAMKAAAEGKMKGILAYTHDPLVSSDIIGDPHSSIFAADWTQVMGDNMLKVVSWYDNEWGYSCRTVDLIARFGKPGIAAAGLLLIAGSATVALLGTSLWHFWIALILLGVGWNFGFIASTAMVAELYRHEEAFRVQAMNEFILFSVVAIASFSSGGLLVASGWMVVNLLVYPIVAISVLLIVIQAMMDRRAPPQAATA